MPAVRHRFFVQDAGAPGTTVVLSAEESAHATRVLRLRPGAAIGVFDGRGRELAGVVAAVDDHVLVRLDAEVPAVPEPAVAITLAHAVLKGDKMDAVVRDAVMLGAAAIRPIVSRRSETTVSALERGSRIERWRRVAVASAKQCGRAVVPEVLAAVDFVPAAAWFETVGLPAPRLVLAEPGARRSAPVPPSTVGRPMDQRATLLVGPEGGWAQDEIEALETFCTLITLGPRTLRADVAALAAMAALFAVWGIEG
jgi:16S rRNA (uracil1498-N3)-methyltransferase